MTHSSVVTLTLPAPAEFQYTLVQPKQMSDVPNSVNEPFSLKVTNGTLSISNGVYNGDLLEDPSASNGHGKARHGRGTMKYFNSNVYDGEWVNDFFEGKGEYIWADGRKFIGTFKKDKIDGSGIGTWPDGRKYEGEYKMDLAHGKGFVTLPNGRIFEGTFAADFPVDGLMIDSNGTLFAAKFDGKTHVSEWRPTSKTRIGKFEAGWGAAGHSHSLREFEWADGRRFAGACSGPFCPASGVLTESDGSQHLVAYDGAASFAQQPSPMIQIRLKTKVRRARGRSAESGTYGLGAAVGPGGRTPLHHKHTPVWPHAPGAPVRRAGGGGNGYAAVASPLARTAIPWP